MVRLVTDRYHGPDAVAVAHGTCQLQDQPGVRPRADILPDFRTVSERRCDHVDSPVLVEVGKRASAMCAHSLQKFSPGSLRCILKSSVPHIPEDAVVLLVFGRLEGFHPIVHMGVCREYVFESVVVEIDKPNAPAAIYAAQ